MHTWFHTCLAQKILNGIYNLGANEQIRDIKKAVESVGNRDYPELNHDKIPPIYVPEVFIAQYPEAIDYEKYIKQLKSMSETFDFAKAEAIRIKVENCHKRGRDPELSDEEKEMLGIFRRIDVVKRILGEYAEKEAHQYLKSCIDTDEVIVINHHKIMKLEDLDMVATNFEKDFLILNLTKRLIFNLEVKANCHEHSLESSRKQLGNSKELIDEWCGANLTEKNGWQFFSAIYFQGTSQEVHLCNNCQRYIIFGNQFKEKFKKMTESIPMFSDHSSAREEFKEVVTYMLFLASYEPVITPAKTTEEVEKMVDQAGSADNIIFWNQLFCWTRKQLAFLRDSSLRYVIFISAPSTGKTTIMKAKCRYLAEKGEKVLILLPTIFKQHQRYFQMQTLLSIHLHHEFSEYKNVKIMDLQTNQEKFSFNSHDILEIINEHR